MKPALVSVFALAIILSSCSSSLPAAAPTGTPATPDATKTATPTRTPSPAPTETPTPTPEYPTSCFDQAVIDQVVADFPAKDRGPNGDGVGAGRTVEEVQKTIHNPYSGRIESASSFPPPKGNLEMPWRILFDGVLLGHTHIQLSNGDIGLCGIVVDKDGNKYPVLTGVEHNGKFNLAAYYAIYYAPKYNRSSENINPPATIEAMEELLNARIGRISGFDITFFWKSSEAIGHGLFTDVGLDALGEDTYYTRLTTAYEQKTLTMGVKLNELLSAYLEDDAALLLNRMLLWEE